MNSIRPVALSLCLAAACGGALLFSLQAAKGQPAANTASPSTMPSSGSPSTPGSSAMSNSASSSSSSPGAAASTTTTSTTGSAPLKQVIGISPVQTGKKNFIVFGGTGNESYDLQYENVYSLLRQRGVQIPNILHPLSTAKPSFIVERLIVLSLTGGNNGGSAPASGGASSGGSSSSSSSGAPGASGAAATAPAGPSDAERTIAAVRAVVDAEISRGSGRAGGAHRQKLILLSRAIASLQAANSLGAAITQAVGASTGGSSSSSAAAGGDKSKLDPREVLYGQARITSRAADRYAPTGL